MNKLIIPIIVVAIIVVGIGGFLVLQEPRFPEPQKEKTTSPFYEAEKQKEIKTSQDSPFGIHDPIIPEVDTVADVAATGAKWIRYAGGNGIVWDSIEPEKGIYRWSRHDKLYTDTYNSGIKMFVSAIAASRVYKSEHGYMPKDMGNWVAFLKKVVERYDGDGVDDAPGSPVVDVWQIENELDLNWKDKPEDYAKFLKESFIAIKQVNPKAKVAIAGVADPAGFTGETTIYGKIFKELDKIKNSSGDRYFDIFDFHWYPFATNYLVVESFITGSSKNIFYLKEYINNIKRTLAQYDYVDIPIYITEFGQYSEPPGLWGPPEYAQKLTFHSEKKQALDLSKGYLYSRANGVQKIFWVTLTEWHNFGGQINGVFDNVGLINNPKNSDGLSHKKLAYYTYKKMTEILKGSDWDNIGTIQESDGVYVYKFKKGSKNIWVAWNDNFASKTITISGISSNQVKITEAVPKYETGKEVTDYNTAFETETKVVNGGKITITLKDKPVFVEEK
jgi:hypothetical protein